MASRSASVRTSSKWPTTAQGSRRSTCRTCSSASTRRTRRAADAAPALGSRSRRRTRTSSAARSRSRANPAAVAASPCAYNRYRAVTRARQDVLVKKLLALVLLVVAAGAAGWFLSGLGSDKAVSLGAPPAQVTTTVERTGLLPSGSSFAVWLVRKGRLVEALRAHGP